jgi:protein-disulfide isomerase
MTFLRWPTVLSALVALAGGTCRTQTDAGDGAPKPAASAPEVHIKEVDTSALTPRERREWAAQVSELLAPCSDTPVSIAQCAMEHRACKTCIPAAQFLLRQVQAGKPKKDREEAFHARFDANKLKTLVLDGSPEKGAPDAPVTIVEWADFECPFCKMMYPLLEELYKRFDGQVRIVYKFYPLSAHPHGEIAARAAIAAAAQGKFWEMHHMLFDHQERLEQADLEGYAKEIGLDVPKFKAALVAKTTDERIEADKKQADGLGLDGTPFLFIDNREVDLEKLVNPYDDLERWVKLEIELAGQTPHAPPPEASAAPSASAAASAAAGAPSASASASAKAASSASAKPASAPAPHH